MDELIQAIRDFNAARDWAQFHSPKNLLMALCVEVAELAEIFIWLTPEQSASPAPETIDKIRDEIGDVLIYLINVADAFDIELINAAWEKLAKNAVKYPE